ncbi:MAG: antibiotic biosynthesis monooxygenase [Deinococcota bacterium]
MVFIHVTVTVKPTQQTQFETNLASIVQEAKEQDGCHHYAWYRIPNDAHTYVVYGEFEDRHAFDVYKKSHVVKRIGTELLPLLTRKPTFKHVDGEIFEQV